MKLSGMASKLKIKPRAKINSVEKSRIKNKSRGGIRDKKCQKLIYLLCSVFSQNNHIIPYFR